MIDVYRRKAAKAVIEDLKDLAVLTSDDRGAQRLAWTHRWDQALEWFQAKMSAEGAEISIDAAHNVFAKIPGETDEAILIGSHLDSVPNGGWLDGTLGVLVGLAIARYYNANHDKHKKTIYIVSWADEEGVRFGQGDIGSSAVSGSLNTATAARLTDDAGISFGKALEAYDSSINDFPKAQKQFLQKNITHYLELHIEQGPRLEQQGKSVGCVYGIAGCERQSITFTGQAAHAGSPIDMRKDALLAAAQAVLAFREIGLAHDAFCTVGKINVEPDVISISPGSCMVTLDQRSINADVLNKIYNEAQEACRKAASDNHVSVTFEHIWSLAPVLFDKKLLSLCQEAVTEETGSATTLYSGPFHDAAVISRVVPSIMMFAKSSRGLSHCPEEDTPEADLIVAISAFLRLVEKVLEIHI